LPEFLKPEIIRKALVESPKAIQFVPEELQTETMVASILAINGLALEDVAPKWRRDKAMIDIALNQNPLALKFVPEELQTEEMCLKAVQRKRSALGCVKSSLRFKILHLLEEKREPVLERSKRKGIQIAVEEEFKLPSGLVLPEIDPDLFKGQVFPPPPPYRPLGDQSPPLPPYESGSPADSDGDWD
jgi:hypothetical protein